MLVRTAIAGLVALAIVPAWAGFAYGAPAGRIQPLSARATAPGPGFGFYRDRVIDKPSPVASAAIARGFVRRYAVPGGSVEIATSQSFPDTPENQAAARSFASFLGSRLHNRELTTLRVFIGTELEIAALCGGVPGVLACYARHQRRMFVPNQDPSGGGPFTREYAVTHEYGHHIAANRSHHPFPALSYGAKYWSSYKFICARARRGELAPGNQTTRYAEDPGEGFADTYAHIHYPGVIWQYAELMRPDAGAFAAVRRDVRFPWRGPKQRQLAGSLGGASVRGFGFSVRLDGIVSFRLNGPRGTNYDLELVNAGQVVRATRAPGSRDTMSVLACRSPESSVASVALRVVRRSGSGRFTVRGSIVG